MVQVSHTLQGRLHCMCPGGGAVCVLCIFSVLFYICIHVTRLLTVCHLPPLTPTRITADHPPPPAEAFSKPMAPSPHYTGRTQVLHGLISQRLSSPYRRN